MKTYGTTKHCQGCDQTAECLPWLVTWSHTEWLGTGDDREPTERVYYCVDCAHTVLASSSIQGVELEAFAPDWENMKRELPGMVQRIETVARQWCAPLN